jgi:hypothetical protein
MFSIPPGMLRQLYVIAPICTPPKFESGEGVIGDPCVKVPFSPEPGTIVSAAKAALFPIKLRLDNLILVYFNTFSEL